MLQFTPDNYKYHKGLRSAMKLQPDAAGALTDAQREQLTQLYNGLQEQYPRSSAAKRIPLDFKAGSAQPKTLVPRTLVLIIVCRSQTVMPGPSLLGHTWRHAYVLAKEHAMLPLTQICFCIISKESKQNWGHILGHSVTACRWVKTLRQQLTNTCANSSITACHPCSQTSSPSTGKTLHADVLIQSLDAALMHSIG